MIEVSPFVKIDENELQLDYIRASGPGGQNVNKVSSAVQLRWNVRATAALNDEVKARLQRLAGSRMTEDGVLIIEAKRYRTQEQNRLDALQRLMDLVQRALQPPKSRHATRPTLASKQRRVQQKRQRSEVKRQRREKAPNE
jgi:ribosome-associated protein